MSWHSRLRNLLHPNRVSNDIQREMQFHVAERVDDLVSGGMSRPDAEREAHRMFGHRSTHHENTRDADMNTWLESFNSDVKQGFRVLRASPAFTIVAVVSLALGIGANTAIFSLINAVMVKSLPVERPEELVTVAADAYGSELNFPLWEKLRDSKTGLASSAVFSATDWDLSNGGLGRNARGDLVSGNYFPMLGVRPAAGRLFTQADDTRGCAPIVVLGYGFWQSEFGGAQSAIGKNISLSGTSYTIVGVTPPEFYGATVGRVIQIYAPLCAHPVIANGTPDRLQHMWFLSFIGRLAPGTSLAQVNANVSAAMPSILEAGLAPGEYQDALKEIKKYQIRFTEGVTALSSLRQTYSKALIVLMTVVGVVLLIGCANVANLLLARAAAREREIAVRFALGASRMRVLRQLLTETMLLTTFGAVAGVLFAKWSSSLLVQLLSSGRSPVGLDVPIDGRVLLFTTAVATLTGLLFGLAPAWRASRTSPQEAMRSNARGITSGHTKFSTARALVIGQVALSLILVVGAGLLLGTFRRLSNMNPGFVSEGVMLVNTNVTNAGFGPEQIAQFPEDLMQRMRAIPGVVATSASDISPISGTSWNGFMAVPGFTPTSPKESMVYLNQVTGDYFKTMGTRIIAGRSFDARDRIGTQKVALINESIAKKFFAGTNPVGKHFSMPSPRDKENTAPAIEIIGVVEDSKYSSLKEAPRPVAYLAMSQADDLRPNFGFEVRSAGNTQALTTAITNIATQINPRIQLSYRMLDAQIAASITRERLLATLSAFFGGLALLLAMIGLYGTLSYGVSRRRNEIGIRLALGAERANVLRMVLGEVARMLAIGVVIGIAGAIATSKYVASFLFGVEPNDITTLVMSAAVLTCVALAAGALPAWRASRLDPMLALRED
jgi:putative ABC transport system permease protein